MSSAFSRTLRSLQHDGARGWFVGLGLTVILLGAWTIWFFAARVTLFAVSSSARLEAGREVHPVESPVAGRITALHVRLGQDVRRGDLLVELDAMAQWLELQEEAARKQSIAAQILAARSELESARLASGTAQQAAGAGVDAGLAHAREAEAAARLAEEEKERMRKLHAQGLVSAADLSRAATEASRRRAAAEALQSSTEQLQLDQRSSQSDRLARIDGLERQLASLLGQLATSSAASARLEEEIERRRIRAPVDGRVGEIATLQVGSVITESERLAAVVPEGELRIVADFEPSVALGRVQQGQHARMRLEGFPWMQYGSLAARVVSTATEARGDRVRVELALLPDTDGRLPLQHGLPGSVEVEVDTVSPAALVLRAAGKLLATPTRPPDSAVAREDLGQTNGLREVSR